MTAIDVLMFRRRTIIEDTNELRGQIDGRRDLNDKSEALIEEMRRELDDIDAALAKLDPDNYAVSAPIEPPKSQHWDELAYTPRAIAVLKLADEEARRLRHTYIGTEHILLGIIREHDGIAAGVLESMGVSLSKVRTAVEFIVGKGTE